MLYKSRLPYVRMGYCDLTFVFLCVGLYSLTLQLNYIEPVNNDNIVYTTNVETSLNTQNTLHHFTGIFYLKSSA
jgi:hypothetical protein